MDNLKFHRTLIELSKHITYDVLENLKYMCQDVVLPFRMEKVKSPRDLFQALEECGKISCNDTQYLIDLLEAEGKSNLANILTPFNHGSSTNMFQESFMSYTNVTQQQRQARPELRDVSEARLNVYRQVLRQISNLLTVDEVQSLCYCCVQAEAAGVKHKANLTGITLFNFLEQKSLISPDNLDYLRELLNTIGRMDLQNLIEQYTRSYLGREPTPLIKQDVVHQQQHVPAFNPSIPPSYNPSFHPDQRTAYLYPASASMISMQQQPDDSSISTPTQVEDNDDAHNPLCVAAGRTDIPLTNIESRSKGIQILESQRGRMDSTVYQSNPRQVEEKELQHKRDLEQMLIQVQQQQAALQDKEDVINQLTLQYKQQLHLLRQVKTESGSEKERLQQQIQDYEQMLQQNNEQIEILRRENQQGPAMIGPVGEKYPMSKIPHGIAVIINNFEFHSTVPGEDPLPERRGSQVDEENLRVTWEYLQYDVRILRNLTASELTRQLMQIALKSHEKYDSFVCCILSHGYLDGVYGTDSKPVKINDIASLFKGNFCPTLADKPKLFFIQACRGDDEDKGVAVQKDAKGDPDDALRHSLPSEADFLFGYATPPGNVSWRSPRYGSWYISKLCEVFVDYSPQQDLLSMLTIVNHKVSEAYTTQGFKQCPAPVTLLRKQVWFFP